MNIKLGILTPVYNDWDCFEKLSSEIITTLSAKDNLDYKIIAVDDGSKEECPAKLCHPHRENVHKLTLARNLGHQRAIAIGLCYIEQHFDFDYVVVMDSDGEDSPSNILDLLSKTIESENIVFAARGNRYSGLIFNFFYKIYKGVFLLLTGVEISFGNFCILPKKSILQLTLYSELWNHFSGSVIKSKMSFSSVRLDRRERYFGSSKMNFSSLILHGVSSISIFLDAVALRLLLFSISLIILLFCILMVILYLKVFTIYSIPGWASTVGLGLLNMIFLLFIISFMMLFAVSYNRSSLPAIPKNIFHLYIQEFK